VTPISVNRRDAARLLGVSLSTFRDQIQAELPVVRRGRIRLFPVAALNEWVERNAERPMAEELRA
jgi:excisionase family DNA binding protein